MSVGAWVLTFILVLAGAGDAQDWISPPTGLYVTASDTDSVVVAIPESLLVGGLADSVSLDSAGRDTTRAERYFPPFRSDGRTARTFRRPDRAMSLPLPGMWQHEIRVDSISGNYISTERVGGADVRIPTALDRDAYRLARQDRDVSSNWQELVDLRAQQRRQSRRGGLGFNIAIPGGRQSAFTTIFGKPDVSLRVNGQADIQAGFDYRKSEQQSILGQGSQLDPQFKQDLRLGIDGNIGDKMLINVNYDTQNRFDFENELKLHYQGYEDEIIQSIEAGNVFLQTPSTLIRGGQSLFGIKSEFQIGGVHLTTVMSQQEGESSSLNISGGSESTQFDIRPIDYDDGSHFFLGYYFRNRWEDALSDPPRILLANGFERITEIEVWRFEQTNPEDDNVREVVAMVDLGESPDILTLANAYTETGLSDLPAGSNDQYTDADIDLLRDRSVSADGFLGDGGKGLNERSDFQTGPFKKLVKDRDYKVNEQLGYVSLSQRLQDSEAIAVSYRYIANGQALQVGDLSTGGGGADEDTRLVLKLLRPRNPDQPGPSLNPAAWYLELRNIYSIRGRGINSVGFDLDIQYTRSGQTPQTKIPQLGGQRSLLDLLGLDRLNEDGAPGTDEQFDYVPNFSILPADGLLIFPYLEPFGERIEEIAQINGTSATDFAYHELYRQKKENARTVTKFDIYRIQGEYKGSVQSFYELGAFAGVVPGTVKVTSASALLTENVDYIVDYVGASVTIINPTYLVEGRNIEIDFEQNSFFNIQKKTLLGLRADYDLSERFALGATAMRLSEKSPQDKLRLGEEPISNFIWGVDGALDLEANWLTRVIDKIPLLQTREASSINVRGEFAQLRPGNTQTNAFSRSRQELQDAGRDFNEDELNGISFVDDFEGFENTFSLMQPGTWRLASPPDSIGAVDGTDPRADSLRTNWRAAFGWYRINEATLREFDPIAYDVNAVRPIRIDEVYPDREISGQPDQTLSTMDIYHDPRRRGPYNFNTELASFFADPTATWGGMVQRLPEGFSDFTLKNTEFVEFIIQPFAENPENLTHADAKLLVDLGFISEDVLPDERLNEEDGLSTSDITQSSIFPWGRLPTTLRDDVIKLDDENDRTEDLGLDGLASYGGNYADFATEAVHFQHFLNSLDPTNPDIWYQAEVARSQVDPSADDYHFFADDNYFTNDEFFPGGATVQQRFAQFFAGLELNGFESQRDLATNVATQARRGNSQFPDSEDLNNNSAPDLLNSYFQYAVPLNKDELDRLAAPSEVNDYVVTEITSQAGERTGWYQIRIPIRDFTRQAGSIQDFSRIESIRIWTTGHEVPVTVRFAALELVGSQWRKGLNLPLDERNPTISADGTSTRISISSVNNEENSSVYLPPRGTIISETRLANGTRQSTREQAMVLRVENVNPQQQLAIFKPFARGLDLLKYSNVRMFAHAHGILADGTPIESLPRDEARSKARLFIRLGANETSDYYEYEQPLTPSPEISGDSDALWQTSQNVDGELIDLNSINIQISALNQLKVERDQRGVRTDTIFWSVDESGEIRGPDASEFAPPGTRLGIRGTPSLAAINTIVIGIRNPASDSLGIQNNEVLDDLTVWINELRVSGYDNASGWSALSTADIKLADLGRVRANLQTQTDGFGSLASTLDDRDQRDVTNWSVTTDLNLHQPIPERFGWSIPVSVQVQSNSSTPRFSPNRGDIRVSDILAQIESRSDISDDEKRRQQNFVRESSTTKSGSRSVSARISKQGSDSRLLRNTLDGLSASYSWSESDASNPSQSQRDDWRWNSSLSYRLNLRRPRTVRPFGGLDGVPVLGLLSGIRFNYLPSSVNASTTATRSFGESQDRTATLDFSGLDPIVNLATNPLRQRQDFKLSRNFAIQYNPFQFLNLSLDTNTGHSLNALGVDTVSVVLDTEGGRSFVGQDTTALIQSGQIQPDQIGISVFQQEQLNVRPAVSVVRDAILGHPNFRTDNHGQRFSATLRTDFNKAEAIDWIDLQDIQYTAQYTWNNGPVSRNDGASISNQVDIRTGLSLKIQDFWRKFDFYTDLEQAQRDYERDKQLERQRRASERARIKSEREQQERARAAADSVAALVDSAGVDSLREPVIEHDADSLGVLDPAGVADSVAVADSADATPEALEARMPSRFRFPLPNPASILRRTVLAVTGIRDFTVTYQASRGSRSTSVGVVDENNQVSAPYSMFDALFRGRGPSLGYRYGFSRTVSNDERVFDSGLQVSDLLSNSDRFTARTTLNLSPALTVNLNWSADLSETSTITQRRVVDSTLTSRIEGTETLSGTNRASVWIFSPSYLDLVRSQLETYAADRGTLGATATIGDENGDGRVVLTNSSVVSDFRRTFVRGSSTLGKQGLLPFPLPGWTVSYTGFGKWPLVRAVVQSATIRHTFGADYSADYRTNSIAALNSGEEASFTLGENTIQFAIPQTEASAVRLNRRFSPLVGVDFVLKGRVQTNVAWNKSSTFSLSTSNFDVSENSTNEITASVTWQKTGLRIPFFGGKRLNNRLSFTLSLARSTTLDQRYQLRAALRNAADRYPEFRPEEALTGDLVQRISSYTRTTVSPQIAYVFSNRVSANFVLKYEDFAGDTRRPSSQNVTGTFNVRVNISG